MDEYLRALEPVMSHQQHDRTKAIVKQFQSPSGLGPILHQYLADKREAEDNWVILILLWDTRAEGLPSTLIIVSNELFLYE